MRADALKGRDVVALTTAEKIGQVDDVLFDPQYREVLGFRVKQGGLFGQTEALLRDAVKADEVLRLGEGGIMIVPDAVGARLRARRG